MSKKALQLQQLHQQLSVLVESVEALLAADTDRSSSHYLALRTKAEQAVNAARQVLDEDKPSLFTRTKRRVQSVDRYVNECPWRSVALGCAAGVICGIVAAKS